MKYQLIIKDNERIITTKYIVLTIVCSNYKRKSK